MDKIGKSKWFGVEPDPEKDQGFVYLAVKDDGSWYIGKKNIWSERKVKIRGQKRRKKVRSPMNWKSYETSSKYVKADLKKDRTAWKWYIIATCPNKATMRFLESKYLWKHRALEDDKCFNYQIEKAVHKQKPEWTKKIRKLSDKQINDLIKENK